MSISSILTSFFSSTFSQYDSSPLSTTSYFYSISTSTCSFSSAICSVFVLSSGAACWRVCSICAGSSYSFSIYYSSVFAGSYSSIISSCFSSIVGFSSTSASSFYSISTSGFSSFLAIFSDLASSFSSSSISSFFISSFYSLFSAYAA